MEALDVLRRSQPPADFCASSEILATDEEDLSNLKSAYLWLDSAPSGRRVEEKPSMGAWDLVKYVLDRFRQPRGSLNQERLNSAPTHLVLALYDTAGELWQNNDTRLLALRARTDTMAVVLDGTALIHFRSLRDRQGNPVPADSPNSAWTACWWLQYAGKDLSRRCVVVTKLDLLEDDPDAKTYLDAVRNQGKSGKSPRDLLLKWLAKDDRIEVRLRFLIEADPELPVFFVWTEGLNDVGRMPVTFGLGTFVNWCVDVRRWMGARAG